MLVLKLVPEFGQYPNTVSAKVVQKKTLKESTFLPKLAISWRSNFVQLPERSLIKFLSKSVSNSSKAHPAQIPAVRIFIAQFLTNQS